MLSETGVLQIVCDIIVSPSCQDFRGGLFHSSKQKRVNLKGFQKGQT